MISKHPHPHPHTHTHPHPPTTPHHHTHHTTHTHIHTHLSTSPLCVDQSNGGTPECADGCCGQHRERCSSESPAWVSERVSYPHIHPPCSCCANPTLCESINLDNGVNGSCVLGLARIDCSDITLLYIWYDLELTESSIGCIVIN